MTIDFDYEVKKVQKELEKIEKLGEEVSKSVRQSLEEILSWAKAGYQKQALREQLKHEFERTIAEKKELLKSDRCQSSVDSVRDAQRNLKDSFTSKSGKDIQQKLTDRAVLMGDSKDDINKLKKSMKSANI
ncbi:hypothetical protein [Carnobacterium maltaromaticum]|uniref:hypothetical protein n=1 Tax=Carnobacterium maltaromaticum TaxID=2751 RepID=UPI00191BA967|nr:hypothetical protein [Carnobacterium maltaromaticum]CAD5902929.1 hypothetical protein CMALT394_560012 [Carnobacterium maltaromaticum]